PGDRHPHRDPRAGPPDPRGRRRPGRRLDPRPRARGDRGEGGRLARRPLLSGRAPANERLRWRLSGRGAHPLASALARPGGGRKTADRLGGRPIPGAQTAAIAGPPVEWVSPQRAMITRKEIALPEAETLSGEIAPGGITSGEITAGASAPPAGLATEPGVTV